MAVGTIPVGFPVRITQAAAGVVAGGGTALSGPQAESATSGQGTILGFFVSSSTSGTIKLTNGTSSAGNTTYLNTTGTLAVGWYPFPLTVASGGIFCTPGGTIDVTFIVAE